MSSITKNKSLKAAASDFQFQNWDSEWSSADVTEFEGISLETLGFAITNPLKFPLLSCNYWTSSVGDSSGHDEFSQRAAKKQKTWFPKSLGQVTSPNVVNDGKWQQTQYKCWKIDRLIKPFVLYLPQVWFNRFNIMANYKYPPKVHLLAQFYGQTLPLLSLLMGPEYLMVRSTSGWSQLNHRAGPSRLVQKGLFQSIEALRIAPRVHQGFGQSLLGDRRGPEDWRIRNWMEPENPITLWWTNIAMENHNFSWENPL